MGDKEIDRLKRLLFWSWCLIIFLVIGTVLGVIFWFSTQVKHLKQEIASNPTTIVQQTIQGRDGYTPIKNVDYFDGEMGLRGLQGPKGESGTNTVTLQPIYSNVPVPGPQGVDGPQGLPGAPGLTVFVQQLPTGEWQCRRGSDTLWVPIAECQ